MESRRCPYCNWPPFFQTALIYPAFTVIRCNHCGHWFDKEKNFNIWEHVTTGEPIEPQNPWFLIRPIAWVVSTIHGITQDIANFMRRKA